MRHPLKLRALLILVMLAHGAPLTAGDSTILGRLYVTASTSYDPSPSALVTFDLPVIGSPVQRETVETGGIGRGGSSKQSVAFDATGRLLFACNNISGDVSVWSLAGDGTLEPVAGSPFPVGAGPAFIALHPDLRVLYVVTWLDSSLRVFSIEADGSLTQTQSVSIPEPRDFEIDPSGRFLYLADMTTGVRGYAISPAGGLTELAGSPFVYASGRTFEIEIAPGGRRVFVLDLDNGIAAFDVAPDGGLALIEGSPFAVGDFSAAMELSPDGSFLYLGSSYYTGINGFVVGPDGAPSPIGDGIPSEIPVELIAPPGAHELVSVRSSPGDIVAYAIAGDGALTQLSDPTAVVDEAHRVPDGAVFVASNCLTSAIDAAVLCDDGHACTADLCDLARGCVNGDANLDASGFSADRVDGRDLVVLADAWNSCPGDLSYAAAANLDQTGCVDVTDFHLFMMAFGRTCP